MQNMSDRGIVYWRTRWILIGAFITIVGVLMLLRDLGLIPSVPIGALVIIAIGVWLLLSARRKARQYQLI